MAITQTIATLPAVLNDSITFYEDIAVRNNSLVTTVLPSINAWATQANLTQTEINAKAAQVAAQAVDGGYSQNYINSNFIGVNNAQDITEVKTFIASPIVPTPVTDTQAVNKQYADLKVALASFTGTNQSLTGGGYQKLPGGLIIQWGANVFASTGSTVVFPVAFPNTCMHVLMSDNDSAAITTFASGDKTATQFTGYGNVTAGATWLAIGY